MPAQIVDQVRKALSSSRLSSDETRLALAEQIVREVIRTLEIPCPTLVYVGTDCCLVRVDAEVPKSDRELLMAQTYVREAGMKIYNEMHRRQNPRDPFREPTTSP